MSEIRDAIADEISGSQVGKSYYSAISITAAREAADAILASEIIRRIKAEAWEEGALWSAVECGAIKQETQGFLAPSDNPYRTEEKP